ncbi:MAG TPA: ASPIC/UnbV domain-containing protein, partial [Methylomirabilota bacterium]|nr:ASPIC/UnbV domain-containing protein [Methylomirabilota bacterium]
MYNRNSPLIKIYRNDSPGQGRALLVDLDGGGRPTEGAQVSVRCGDVTLLRQRDAGAGFLSQNSATLHFGLGECGQVDAIDVRWPDGQEETFPGTAADQRVTLMRGRGQVTSALALQARNFNIDQRPGLTGDLSAPAPAVHFAAFEDGAPLDLRAAG